MCELEFYEYVTSIYKSIRNLTKFDQSMFALQYVNADLFTYGTIVNV